jgi:tRNA(fMet)-specific endonuclease VapC
MYVLDTNICICLIKKQPESIRKKFESLAIGSVSMSLITYGELKYGALRSNNFSKAIAVLDRLTSYIPVLSMHQDVALEYADIRADLANKGTPIGNNDLWIAAHARSSRHTLVTNNLKEFTRVTGLELENWV